MAIILELYKQGAISAVDGEPPEAEIRLTEHSIKKVSLRKDILDLMDANDDVKAIELKGTLNTEKLKEKAKLKLDEFGQIEYDEDGKEKYELREVDSIRKLINWSNVNSESDKCYMDAYVRITDATGKTESEEFFYNLYSTYYSEEFTDKSGHGEFEIIMKEKARIAENDIFKEKTNAFEVQPTFI